MPAVIADELETINLGDKRLNVRARSLISTLAADPQCSINAACGGWDETQAAYRFFDNQNVTPEEILRAHADATRRRIELEDVVLVEEIGGPGDETDVRWLLITSLPIDCVEAVLRVVQTVPSLGEFIKIRSQLGGYNGRAGDPPPGPQAIWTGLRRMTDFALAWKMCTDAKKHSP